MKKAIFFLFFAISINLIAQKQANIWYFGDRAGLDFNRDNPIPLLDGQLSSFEGTSSIADSNGDLLFYTDGVTVYNRDHEIMLNGTDLHGSSTSTQSAMIIPKPLDPNVYYIFTVAPTFTANGLRYSEVDMTLDGGLGGITDKNIPLATPISEKVTATASTIPTEFWVVSHLGDSDEFIAYNVTSTGINTTPVRSSTGTFIDTTTALNSLGQLKISPDGTKLAVVHPGNYGFVQLFDFNASTGEVSNKRTIMDANNDPSLPGTSPYGVEFSPNSNVLYVNNLAQGLYQYDLSSGNEQDIIDSRVTINDVPGPAGALQLGPDERIYLTLIDETSIDRIDDPNVVGLGCNYTQNSVSLGGRRAQGGLPSFIQSYLVPSNILFENQCFGDATSFSIEDSVTSILWDFGDPDSGTNNSSTLETPTHIFSAPGTYTVTVTAFQGSVSIDFSVEVVIFAAPEIETQPEDLFECDADNNGSESFDLTVQDPIILGSQDPNIFSVRYATDLSFSLPITDPANYVNTDASEVIYFRVVNSGNPACTVSGEFNISLSNSISLPLNISDYVLCDDDTDGDETNGLISSFLLSTKDSEILGSLDPATHEVNYFLNENDAINNTNALDKNNPYSNIVAFSQPIYVRVVEISEPLCADTSLQFNLIVSPIPQVTPLIELRQCDDDTDGFSLFNLNEAAQEISTNFQNETFSFYPTLLDAQNATNEISNPITYQNQVVTTDNVWVRTISNGGCFEISEIQLIVSTTLIPSTFARTYSACDDFLDINGDDNANNDNTDGITNFDFSAVNSDVINLFPASQQLIIQYYTNEADALAEQNAIQDISNYRNIDSPFAQQIYIRVDSALDNDCLGLGPFITLTVDPVPTANQVDNLDICDDDADGITTGFNLESQTPLILGSQDPNNFTVTYHTSVADASAGSNPISSTTSYTNITPNIQTIYVRVTDNTIGCFNNVLTFDLIVNEIPIANPVSNLEVCDDDSDGSARNGFSQSFDLESQTAIILGSQDPNQVTVTYHSSLSNAQSGNAPLLSPFSNSVPFSQTIYVRVSDENSGCVNGITTFDVVVNPEPIATEVSNLSYCDDDLDGDDMNGFVQNIDLDSQTLGILDFENTGQSTDDFTVTYHETQMDASNGTNAISGPYSNSTAFQQTIFVRITNDTTGCVNDDFTFDIVVNPLPNFRVTTPQIVCLNGPELNLFIELPNAVYDYVWTDPSGNTLIGEEISISSGGLYLVTATTTDGTECSRTREILVNESIIATLTEDDITIVDDSDNNSITIDPTNLGIGDYEFALLNENGTIIRSYQDDTVFDNLKGGIYTILVNDKNGCGVSELEVSVVEFPKFFTPNNDGINDTWTVRGVNSQFFQEAKVNIFNRYGKLIVQIDIDDDGWDGTFNSNLLPSDDYWYAIKLVDRNGVLRERKGNFSLIRTQR